MTRGESNISEANSLSSYGKLGDTGVSEVTSRDPSMAEMPGMRCLTRLLFGQHLTVHLGMTELLTTQDASNPRAHQ